MLAVSEEAVVIKGSLRTDSSVLVVLRGGREVSASGVMALCSRRLDDMSISPPVVETVRSSELSIDELLMAVARSVNWLRVAV